MLRMSQINQPLALNGGRDNTFLPRKKLTNLQGLLYGA